MVAIRLTLLERRGVIEGRTKEEEETGREARKRGNKMMKSSDLISE